MPSDQDKSGQLFKKYKTIFDNSGSAIMIFDKDSGKIIDANAKALDMYGFSEIDELNNKDFWPEPPYSFKEALKWIRKAAEEGPQHIEWLSRKKTGEHFWEDVYLKLISIDGTERVMSTAIDITMRKKVEKKVAEYTARLENAYVMLDEEINKAAELYKRILPAAIPPAEGISVAANYQPAARLGGDFYNVIKSGNKLIFYLSDVMGHGLDSAVISIFVKEAIDNYINLKPEDFSPGEMLRYLAGEYHRENFPDEQLICIFLGVLDLDNMNLTYVSAGFQTFPLLVLGNGKRKKLNCNGLFISKLVPSDMLNYREYNLTLTPGSTLLISTDGLPEQENEKELYYLHYEDIFYENSHLPPEIIVQAINKDFFFFNNKSLTGNDDITFLVLQVNRDKKEKHRLEIKSDYEELERLYEQILSLTSDFPENENLITCLHEIVVNAIEHANRFDPAKKVTIELTVSKDYILAEIEDQGEGFSWYNDIDKPFDMADLAESGRGIALSRLLSGNLYYNPKGNKATILVQANRK